MFTYLEGCSETAFDKFRVPFTRLCVFQKSSHRNSVDIVFVPRKRKIALICQLLDINVVGCNRLRDTEWISRQDPYVCLEYANSKFRTKTCTDGGKNPTFNEKFVCPLIEGLRELNITVWNSNTLSFDDFIGSGKILLTRVLSSGYDDSTWTLTSRSGKNAGEVRIILHYANVGKEKNKAQSAVSASPYTGQFPTSAPYAPPTAPPPGYPTFQQPSSYYPGYPPVSTYKSDPTGYPPPQTIAYPPPQSNAYPPPPSNAYPPPPSYVYPPPSDYYPPTPAAYPPSPFALPRLLSRRISTSIGFLVALSRARDGKISGLHG
ncbi:hypothetical protein SUGI_0564230 [Cryptomeria japonica]|nr:hypothetical protein SUGI_0564230 [Cryptomeria japonica]